MKESGKLIRLRHPADIQIPVQLNRVVLEAVISVQLGRLFKRHGKGSEVTKVAYSFVCCLAVMVMLPGWVTPARAASGQVTLSVLKDINHGGLGSHPMEYTPAGKKIYFVARNAWNQPFQLWATNGTRSGTVQLSHSSGGAAPDQLTALGNELFFEMNVGSNWQLWKSNGTPAGTHAVKATLPNICPCGNFTPLGDKLVFQAGGGSNSFQPEPWVTDGTDAGTFQLKDIPTNAEYLSSDHTYATVGNDVYFASSGNSGGDFHIWKTDGRPSGTVQVSSAYAWLGALTQVDLVSGGSTLFFVTEAANGQGELWKINGSGTPALVKQFAAETSQGEPSLNIGEPTSFGRQLVFSASDSAAGREVWSSDGTPEGTHMVMDIVPGKDSSYPQDFTTVGTDMYFEARPGKYDYFVYRAHLQNGNWTVSQLQATHLLNPSNFTASGAGMFLDVRWDLSSSDTGLAVVPVSSGEPAVAPNVSGRGYHVPGWFDSEGAPYIAYDAPGGFALATLLINGRGAEPVVIRWQ